MNLKQAKKIRQVINRAKPDVVQMFEGLKAWPFRMRISLAWQLLKGLPQKETNMEKARWNLRLYHWIRSFMKARPLTVPLPWYVTALRWVLMPWDSLMWKLRKSGKGSFKF